MLRNSDPYIYYALSLDFSYVTVIIDLNFLITTEENPQTWLISRL